MFCFLFCIFLFFFCFFFSSRRRHTRCSRDWSSDLCSSDLVGDGGGGAPGFWSDVYMSGTTFFTLGLGDVVPRTALAKTLTVIEAGTGFAFLAAVIGYFPVIYQAFSRREVAISLLDARAGSPPSASELLWRHRGDPGA